MLRSHLRGQRHVYSVLHPGVASDPRVGRSIIEQSTADRGVGRYKITVSALADYRRRTGDVCVRSPIHGLVIA